MNEETLQEALYEFWSAIARQHPEIKTGDLDPLAVIEFDEAARVYERWLLANAPQDQP